MATKDYIDLHDLGFEETDLESMDTEAPRLTLTEYGITNKTFLELLENYDTVLKNTNDETAIASIINQVLVKYEEVVISGS